MGVKVGLTSLFHRKRDTRPVSSPPASWLWPSCKHPMTHSLRKEDSKGDDDEVSDGMNSPYLEYLTESCFSSSSEAELKSSSTASEEEDSADEVVIEAVARGIRSDRLFFEPGIMSSMMEEAAKADEGLLFEGSIAMEVDSEDPYWDFRSSMEEVVMAHGVMDVQWLEEMLCWYLKMNGKRCHGIIVEAFLDLLLSLASSFTIEMKDEEQNVTY